MLSRSHERLAKVCFADLFNASSVALRVADLNFSQSFQSSNFEPEQKIDLRKDAFFEHFLMSSKLIRIQIYSKFSGA